MLTFDEILPTIRTALEAAWEGLQPLDWLLINRDLTGRVRLVVPESFRTQFHPTPEAPEEGETTTIAMSPAASLRSFADNLSARLAIHGYPPSKSVLFESDLAKACQGASAFRLSGFENVWVVDRLATEGEWSRISPEVQFPPRIVFFSIKGGVGRSTALAASAWSLAQAGKRVLVLDLDLESPGLSSSLLPSDRQPSFGITDWLVEDLVGNGDTVFSNMIATSTLAHDGEIYVSAHGALPGDYVAKLGRVWMPKVGVRGERENWSARLKRLIAKLEQHLRPDVVLLDSRAGIDEVASSCVTDLGATLVLLFSIDGNQTWNGYQILFDYWLSRGVADEIRERLQVVGALLPELGEAEYLEGLREQAASLFESIYDAVPPGDSAASLFNFDPADTSAPHYPWGVKWHRSFVGLRSLDGRLASIDKRQVDAIFGALVEGIAHAMEDGDSNG